MTAGRGRASMVGVTENRTAAVRAAGRNWVICTGVAAATLCLYAASGLPGAFYYDDLLLTRDGYGTAVGVSTFLDYELARPLTLLTYFFDYQRAGLSPAAFHWTNFLIHAINAALCAAVVLALGARRWMGALAGLSFALHFVVLESVNYVWARSVLLSSLAILAGLWALARTRGELGYARALLLAALFVTGFLARPDAFLLFAFVFLLPALYQGTLWQRAYLVLLPVAGAAVWIVLARLREPSDRSMGFDLGYSPVQWLASAAAAGLKYFELLIRPDLGSIYHPNPELGWDLWPGLAAALLLVALLIAYRSQRLVLLGGGVIASVIGFSLLVPNLETVADRRIYLAAFGLALVWSGIFGAHPGRWSVALAFLLPASLAVIAAQRNLEWRQPPRILERAERIHPRSGKVQLLLGEYHASRDFGLAVRHLKKAVALEPRLRDARALLGNVYLDRGLWAAAEQEFRAELEVRPHSPYALNGVGVLEFTRGRFDRARAFFQEALRAQPGYEPALQNLQLIANRP